MQNVSHAALDIILFKKLNKTQNYIIIFIPQQTIKKLNFVKSYIEIKYFNYLKLFLYLTAKCLDMIFLLWFMWWFLNKIVFENKTAQ